MEELVTLISNNGIGVVCVAFMIVFINTTLKDNNKVLDEVSKTLVLIQATLSQMNDRIVALENKINRKE